METSQKIRAGLALETGDHGSWFFKKMDCGEVDFALGQLSGLFWNGVLMRGPRDAVPKKRLGTQKTHSLLT